MFFSSDRLYNELLVGNSLQCRMCLIARRLALRQALGLADLALLYRRDAVGNADGQA